MSTAPKSPAQKPGFAFEVLNINATDEAQYESDLRIIAEKTPKQALVVYFGRDEFSDNSKYQFLHSAAQNDGQRHVWCSYNKKLVQDLRRAGLETFDLAENANRSLQLLLRARVAVFSVNPAECVRSRIYLSALAGAIKVQLWHGIGVKRMELQNIEHKNLLDLPTVARMRWSTEIDCIVSPSMPFDAHWRETFGVQNVIRAGYPRNEVLLRPPTRLEMLNVPENLIRESRKKKILIVPTWGAAGARHWTQNLKGIAEVAGRHDLELYLKPHPYEAPALPKNAFDVNGSITVLPATADLYPLLNRFDCMVTDHSSMAFDAFLLDMALVFLEPNDRRFYMTEMLEPPVGSTVASFAELDRLPALLEQAQDWAENRRSAAKKYFETPPLEASRTIHDTIARLGQAA